MTSSGQGPESRNDVCYLWAEAFRSQSPPSILSLFLLQLSGKSWGLGQSAERWWSIYQPRFLSEKYCSID